MKILFIQSPSVEDQTKERVYPIGIVILATIAENSGHSVALIDMNLEEDPFAAVKSAVKTEAYDLIGISLRNIDPLGNKNVSLVPPFFTLISLLRTLTPHSKIIVGGTGFSLFPRELMEQARPDFGLIGEGEIAFPAFLQAFPETPQKLSGLCYFDDRGDLHLNAPIPIFDLKNYIFPNYRLLSPDRYAHINQYAPAIGVETRRGCPLKCAYCSYPLLQGKKIRCRPVNDIVDEIETLYKEYHIRIFHFNDPVVNMPSAHLDAICEEILRRNLKIQWTGFFRENNLNRENVSLYVRSGCNCFSLSPDGLSQAARNILKKDLSENDLYRAAELIAETGVCSLYHFMVNVPNENSKSIEESKKMINAIYCIHRKKKSIGYVVLNQIRLLPQTESTRQAIAEGVIEENQSLLYPLYYNPKPYQNLRYELEALCQRKNTFMWYDIKEKENQ